MSLQYRLYLLKQHSWLNIFRKAVSFLHLISGFQLLVRQPYDQLRICKRNSDEFITIPYVFLKIFRNSFAYTYCQKFVKVVK